VLNLDTRKRKGLRWLLDGVAVATKTHPEIRLDIIGGGSEQSVAAVTGMIGRRGLDKIVRLVGPLSNDVLLARMPSYRGLVLPSLNETFGMVFVEALFAGLPIVYTAGTAIDGYIDDLDVGIAVGPRDVDAIGAAMIELWTRSDTFRANIAAAAPELFAIFDPKRSIAAYRCDVIDAVGGVPAGD
jgi:glycosyltransferase involved in cell wall biosynthesis